MATETMRQGAAARAVKLLTTAELTTAELTTELLDRVAALTEERDEWSDDARAAKTALTVRGETVDALTEERDTLRGQVAQRDAEKATWSAERQKWSERLTEARADASSMRVKLAGEIDANRDATREAAETRRLYQNLLKDVETAMGTIGRELGGTVLDAEDVELAFAEARAVLRGEKPAEDIAACVPETVGALAIERARKPGPKPLVDLMASRTGTSRTPLEALDRLGVRLVRTDTGSLFFGNRADAPSTGTRFQLRYTIVDGELRQNIDDQRAIGDALVAAYAEGGLEERLENYTWTDEPPPDGEEDDGL